MPCTYYTLNMEKNDTNITTKLSPLFPFGRSEAISLVMEKGQDK